MKKVKIEMKSDLVPLMPAITLIFGGGLGGWINEKLGLVFALPIFLLAVLFWGYVWVKADD